MQNRNYDEELFANQMKRKPDVKKDSAYQF
jgi:hypothetical protein